MKITKQVPSQLPSIARTSYIFFSFLILFKQVQPLTASRWSLISWYLASLALLQLCQEPSWCLYIRFSMVRNHLLGIIQWSNFSAIVYIAVRIHVMFDYMNYNVGFFYGKTPLLWFMFMLNIPNLQRVKLDFSCFISCYVYDKHNMNLAVLFFLKTYACKHESKHKR